MTIFLIKRLGWILLTLWLVFTASFFLMRAVPGGPFKAEKNIPLVIEEKIKARYNLDAPIWEQYLTELGKTITFQPNPSFKLEDYTVGEIIAEGLPISATLGILALSFALTLGLTAGLVSAIRRHSWLDYSFMAAATLGISIPNFVVASVAVIIFVFTLGWLPAAGWGTIPQLILPSLCLGAPFAAYIARLTRTGMLEVLGQDYIRTAYAKGLSERRVVLRHALRGALLPVVSYLGPATAGILTGSLVLEKIFALPGMGSHFVLAANDRDYTLAMGVILVYTVILLVMNTLVDISYSIIDPRVKLD